MISSDLERREARSTFSGTFFIRRLTLAPFDLTNSDQIHVFDMITHAGMGVFARI